jgi:hypothetical protein
VYHASWLTFVIELAALLAFRGVLDALLTRAAWPTEVPLPPWREHVRRSLRFTAIQVAVLLLFAPLSFAPAVTSLSWLFFVAIPVLLFVAVLVHHGAVEPSWWRNAPSASSTKAVLPTFVVMTVGGGVIAESPSWSRPLLAAITGVAVAACRVRMVHALAGRTVVPRKRPFAVVGLFAVLVLVTGGTTIGFAVSLAVENARTPPPEVRAGASGPPVLIVKGFNSKWDGVTRQEVSGSFRIRRFSYRGLDSRDEPERYQRSETHRPIRSLVRAMRAQVAAFRRSTGQDVNIVAESEGALVAQAYVAATSGAPVRSLVLLSPLAAPGRVFYPTLGDDGWGVATGAVMHGLASAIGGLGPVEVSPDSPLFRSMVDEEPALGVLLACPPPRVRSFAVLPLDSGVSAPAPFDIGYRYAVVPAFHGGLLGDGTTQDLIHRVLRGAQAEGSAFWSFAGDVVNAGAAAWQVPSLERALEPRWNTTIDNCRAVRAELRRWAG